MEKTIKEFLSDEYKVFSLYTIESRAIPSCIDGFKPTARKVIACSINTWKTGNEKPLKVFQLAGQVASTMFYHHGNCLDENTEIILANGTKISLKEWYTNFKDKKLEVLSYNEQTKEIVIGIGHSPRIGSITDIEYEIELESGEIIKCTNNHPFLLKDGTWKEAKDLTEDDDIMNI